MDTEWDADTLARLKRIFREEMPKPPPPDCDQHDYAAFQENPFLIRPQARKFLIRFVSE
jgi:hypothetical protein